MCLPERHKKGGSHSSETAITALSHESETPTHQFLKWGTVVLFLNGHLRFRAGLYELGFWPGYLKHFLKIGNNIL